MLEAGISSTWHIARGFGLLTVAAQPKPAPRAGHARPDAARAAGHSNEGAGAVISKALRAAGLLPG